MLNVVIPESTSQKSAEDKVAEYALHDIDIHGVGILSFFRQGGAMGSFWNGDRYEFVGLEAITSVADAFRKAGYIVQRKDYSDNMSKYYIK